MLPHLALLLVLAATGIACDRQETTCSSLEARGAGDREAAFHALTAVHWEDAGCQSSENLAPTCTRLALRADGSYTLRSVSDYVERDDTGRWSFALGADRSGVVCLDGAKSTPMKTNGPTNVSSVLAFSVADDRLALGSFNFSAGSALDIAGALFGLDDVHLPTDYIRLLGEWTKSNAFDLYSQPTELRFEHGGRFFASHHTGCNYGGSFSWDKGIFTPISDPNTCDERGSRPATIASSNDEPQWVDDLLVFYQSSFRRKGLGGPEVFYFDPYTNELRVRGELEAPLGRDVATQVRLRFDNLVPRARNLESLTVRIATLTPASDGNGYSLDGDWRVLATRDFAGLVVEPNGSYADAITIAPDRSGEHIALDFVLAYRDDRQHWGGSRTYLRRIEP